MATELGPDLTFAREQVERLMDDRCVIVRPAVLEPDMFDTAPRVYPPAESLDVDGQCMISERPEAGGRLHGEEEDEYRTDARAGLPISVDYIAPGDVLRVESTRSDDQLVGRIYIIQYVRGGTLAVSRRLGLVRYEPANPWQLPDDEVGP